MSSLLFIVDPWPQLKVYKDSSLALARVALRYGYRVFVAEAQTLSSGADGLIGARVHHLHHAGTVSGEPIAVDPEGSWRPLRDFSATLMRQDPPFNMNYVTALWLLRRAEQQGARVVNAPTAVLNHNEKLSILEFPEHTPPTLVSAHPRDIHQFLATHGEIVIKPLDGMGGRGIFRIRQGEINLNAILEMSLAASPTLMAQKYLPEIAEGDKRVFVLGGIVQPFVLARIPKEGETRGNLAAGGRDVAQPISDAERRVAQSIAPTLLARGLVIVGLDMIGDRLTEINVTSPTCMVEIEKHTGYPIAEHALSAVLAWSASNH